MKIGIMIVVILAFAALSGWLFFDNVRLHVQYNRLQGEGPKQMRAQLAATSNEVIAAKAEISRLNNEIAFPIRLTCKKGTAGKGYSIQVFNNSDQLQVVSITVSNAAQKKSKALDFQLNAGFSQEISHLIGWQVASNDG